MTPAYAPDDDAQTTMSAPAAAVVAASTLDPSVTTANPACAPNLNWSRINASSAFWLMTNMIISDCSSPICSPNEADPIA